MSSFRLFKKIASKKAAALKDGLFGIPKGNPTRVDAQAPLGLHIGGKIQLDQTPLILGGDNLIIEPYAEEMTISAMGTISWAGSTVYRFYLEDDDENHAMLQVVPDAQSTLPDAVSECRLFASHDIIYPGSKEDWDFWLNEESGLIGWRGFAIDGMEYARMWGDRTQERFSPVIFTETIASDPVAADPDVVEHACMLYSRLIMKEPELAEFALVSVESDSDEAAIHIMLGLNLNPISVKTLY